MLSLRVRLEAAASDDIPMSTIVEQAGGIEEVKKLDPANAKAALQRAAREIQRYNKERAPATQINTETIDDWVEKYMPTT